MKLIDTHTHLNASQLFENRKELILNAKKVGVCKIINNGDTFESFKNINILSNEYPDFCYSALGIFPNEDYSDLDEIISRLEKEIKASKNVIAIGEIGLDYHYSNSLETKTKQKALFLAQIKLAEKLNLPIIVHSRDAEADTFNTLIDSKFKGNITLHCYSASFQMALRYLRHHKNTYFGIGGVLTFKNARKLVEVVERVPYDHFLLETDAPYLAPTPYRGKLNQPAYLIKTLEKMAELLKMDIDQLAEQIYKKSCEVYDLPC